MYEASAPASDISRLDRKVLAALMENFEWVMAEGPAPQTKHLLRRLAKKVRVCELRRWDSNPRPSD